MFVSRKAVDLMTTVALATLFASLLMMQTTPVRAGVVARVERAITNESNSVQICAGLTPCGWAIYTPFVRRIDYFVKNGCQCAPGVKCVKTSDDVSVSAYVYQCLPDK